MQQTFTDFKNDFYKRVPDLTLFDCGDINLLKVILDGLKVNYMSKGKINTYLFYPLFVYNFIRKLKQFRIQKDYKIYLKNSVKSTTQKYLVSDVGRIITLPNGTVKSLYFENIVKSLGRENTLIVADKLIDVKLDHDVNSKELQKFYESFPFTQDEILLREKLINTYNLISQANIFTTNELQNIKVAFQLFFNQYKVWNTLLNNHPHLQVAYFICHYHKEGQIYALKKHNIECIELQHGLIAPQDIFYLFPNVISEIKHKALFADKMYVYGKYWKELLLTGNEYNEKQIEVLGYYLFDDFSSFENEKLKLDQFISSKNVILVTTQTFLHQYFIDFVKQLEAEIKRCNENSIIILKTHPAEDVNIYKNEFKNSEIVKVLEMPLPILLSKANLHISIYSTTLYDALRFGVKNFVFKANGCEDYTNEILKSGIATLITNIDELLKIKIKDSIKIVNADSYYSQFNDFNNR